MKTSIYFVRHGEVHNPDGIWYGRLPRFGLSEKGKKQALQAAQFLKSQNIHALYSSHQLRARQTAKLLKETLAIDSIHLSSKLLEVHSPFQGKPFTYARSINFDSFGKTIGGITGETLQEVLMRMQTFIKKVLSHHPGKNVVAVSHGDPIMLLRVWAEGLPITNASLRPGREKYIKHAEVYRFQFGGDKYTRFEPVFTPQV